jgi:F0F1-type ATP synthase membrane subunit b/b'
VIPDITAVWVIALLLICVVVLNTLIFNPILAMSESRAKAVRDARELAASAAQKAAEASATFDRTLASARAEVYAQMDEARRTALAKRAAVMAETKQETERDLHAATTRLAEQAAAARTSLERDAAALAGDIVGRVLGRTA